MKLGEIIIAGRNAPFGAVIYIIKDGDEILEEIINSGNESKVSLWISNKEVSLIRSLRPKYNIQFNY